MSDLPVVDGLSVGDRVGLPDGGVLTVVGVVPASEAPASTTAAPLYEVEKGGIDGTNRWREQSTMLYRPHHLAHALDAGGEIGEPVDVDEPTEPFWCDACEMPHRGRARRDTWLIDAELCSYDCREQVVIERARGRMLASQTPGRSR